MMSLEKQWYSYLGRLLVLEFQDELKNRPKDFLIFIIPSLSGFGYIIYKCFLWFMDHDSETITKNFYLRMSGSRRASVISSLGADEIAELFEKLFDNLNQFKFTEAREFISKSAKKLPRKVFMRYFYEPHCRPPWKRSILDWNIFCVWALWTGYWINQVEIFLAAKVSVKCPIRINAVKGNVEIG